jgi:hypothetical protein
MNIENRTMNVFLHTENPCIFSNLCISYEFLEGKGMGKNNLGVNLISGPEKISKELEKYLVYISKNLPKPALEIIFHNGGKNEEIKGSDEYNDERFLRNKLILHDYLEIISLLQSQPLSMDHQPKISIKE